MDEERLIKRAVEFRVRFVGETLPFLIDRGWDWKRGGLIERLTPGGEDAGTPFRRIMVHARQLYVFSSWGAATGDVALIAHAERIFAYMVENFWDSDQGGWSEKVDLDGRASSVDKDLYAHAFALFGLGSYRDALGHEEASPWIARTQSLLQRRFLRDDGSFSDRMTRDFQDLAADRRSQNPHMHLLEASLSLVEAGHIEPFGALSKRLLALFERVFHDQANGVVLEHLDQDFAPHPEDGHRVEPGHHFEWAWLLDWAGRVLGDSRYRGLAEPILAQGLARGWDQANAGVFDELDRRDGAVLLSTKRIWPLLELIKALGVFPGARSEVGVTEALDVLLERYLAEDGRWTERFNADWSPADDTMPASTTYHISMALQELERVRAQM